MKPPAPTVSGEEIITIDVRVPRYATANTERLERQIKELVAEHEAARLRQGEGR